MNHPRDRESKEYLEYIIELTNNLKKAFSKKVMD